MGRLRRKPLSMGRVNLYARLYGGDVAGLGGKPAVRSASMLKSERKPESSAPSRGGFLTRRNVALVSLAAFVGVASKRLVGDYGSSTSRATKDREVDAFTRALSPRAVPVRVASRADLTDLVPSEGLGELARRAIPCWYALKTSYVMHAFRLWGSEATFPIEVFARPFDGIVSSGADLQRYLLDDEYYSTMAPGEAPLLSHDGPGVEARTRSTGFMGSFVGSLGHPDDLLCACAEVGLGSDQEIMARDSRATIRDLVAHAMWRFDVDKEVEWTVEALARYLAPHDRWTNGEGVVFTFQDAAETLVARPIGRGACLGTHVPNTLACLLRIAETEDILSPESVRAIQRRLEEYSVRLESDGDERGAWTAGWASGRVEGARDPHAVLEGKLAATGHHLEWIAIAPPQCRPSRDRVRSAVRAIVELALDLPSYEVSHLYLPFSHLVRALCLIGNTSAGEASRKGANRMGGRGPQAGATAGKRDPSRAPSGLSVEQSSGILSHHRLEP